MGKTKSGNSIIKISKIESEDLLVKEALLDHVVKGWHNFVDGDGVIAQTQDTIKSTKGEGQARFAGGLTKFLLLDLQVSNLKGVLRDEPCNASRAISDLEVRPILLVG